jgi:hypothetical protein
MKKFFKLGQKLKRKIIYDPLIFANNSFAKFDPLTATGMALCVNLGPKCQNFIPLSLRLSGIKFSLVSD